MESGWCAGWVEVQGGTSSKLSAAVIKAKPSPVSGPAQPGARGAWQPQGQVIVGGNHAPAPKIGVVPSLLGSAGLGLSKEQQKSCQTLGGERC